MLTINLYRVDYLDEHSFFVFTESRNKARALCVNRTWDERYIDLSAHLLKKDVGGDTDTVIDDPDDTGYARVLACGQHFYDESGADCVRCLASDSSARITIS